ncbi:hypothetical protein HNR25_003778 [Streptomonospora salina]|uniref:Uncharacterized protein n=2 Tax=Streptomonospora salina TaxID=104205 RepID=A0A841E7V2_9ACTN|nr:hypothetical protein [Streptomonospora salina]
MRATVAHWDLGRSEQTVDTLRALLYEEGVDDWTSVHGLLVKFWFSDRKRNIWGAVMLWEPGADLDQPLPPNRARELIGYAPTHRLDVEVEVTVEGLHCTGELTGLGAVWESKNG